MTTDTIRSREDAVLLSEIAANAGAIMLANGAEVYRVEDTVERIIRSKDSIKDVDVWSSFNVIIISFSYEGHIHSNVRRVKSRSNNLYYVDKVNTFSRNFSKGLYSLDEAVVQIEEIKKSKGVPARYKIFGATVAGGAYSFLIGAGLMEIVGALFVALTGYAFTLFLEKNKLNYFVVHFLYGFFVALISTLVSLLTSANNDIIIISAMMAFLPGMLITNAVRDVMSGDAISGMTGAAIAILISIGLALGVAIPISLFSYMGLI